MLTYLILNLSTTYSSNISDWSFRNLSFQVEVDYRYVGCCTVVMEIVRSPDSEERAKERKSERKKERICAINTKFRKEHSSTQYIYTRTVTSIIESL